MAWFLLIGVLADGDDHYAIVCQLLRVFENIAPRDGLPSISYRCCSGQPVVLRIGQQDLFMLGRSRMYRPSLLQAAATKALQ